MQTSVTDIWCLLQKMLKLIFGNVKILCWLAYNVHRWHTYLIQKSLLHEHWLIGSNYFFCGKENLKGSFGVHYWHNQKLIFCSFQMFVFLKFVLLSNSMHYETYTNIVEVFFSQVIYPQNSSKGCRYVRYWQNVCPIAKSRQYYQISNSTAR